MNSITNQEAKARKLIYVLLVVLVFEGVLRKALPVLGIGIFFLKDLLCIVGLYFFVQTKLSVISKKTANFFKAVIIFMYPLLLYNLFIDPILLVWGGKLYLLYFVMAILMTIAFPANYKNRFGFFSNLFATLIVVTVLTGVLQLNLPATHWLNRSVGGGSLEAFSSAGLLRISSTFSFTAQYSFFLVFACALFLAFFFINIKNKKSSLLFLFIQLGVLLLLMIGGFNTGGRSAVLGIVSIIIIGFICIGLNNPFFALKKTIIPILIFLFVFPLIQIWKPEYFAAYTERSSGNKNEGILDRVLEPFIQLKSSSFLGHGLGVMTNGSDKISSYAASIRNAGFWTETDFSTIVWEGGLYLIVIWYGFRLFVIFTSFRILLSIKDNNFYSAGAFLFAYILVQGLIGTLTIQPPIAIYFWICFGALICIQKFDEYDSQL
ncbi:hypothetical protein AAGV28_09050 [Flavobacterium sp. FZUC8N2.13]|uniref:O-antigen ligase like membrane protein n=1 Tax=Flavobacterium zubiriense TaxID=3138075 RepID=A0ABV4TBQ5_9FLAO